MAADSRLSDFYDEEQRTLRCYSDSNQKIFIVNGFPMAWSGIYDFGSKSVYTIVNEFNSIEQLKGMDLLNTFGTFVSYISYFYPATKYPYLLKSTAYFIGYVQDSAYLIAQKFEKSQGSAWDNFGSNSGTAQEILKKSYKKIPSYELKDILEKTINEAIKVKHLRYSGGPISIVKISKKNKSTFLKNDFSDRPSGGKLHCQ